MMRIVTRLKRPREGGGGVLFGVVIGFALGVLVAVLIVPNVQDQQTTAGGDGGIVAPGTPLGPGVTPTDPTGVLPGEPGSTSPAGPGLGDGASPGSGTRPENDLPSVRGVTDDTIRIGVGIPDVGPFGAVSAEFDLGDPEEQMRAILDGWRREGLVPVHGRDIEFVFRSYSIFGSDEQLAACRGFVNDDEVFMILAIRSFEAGDQCAAELRTPVVTMNGEADSLYRQTHPYVFTIRASLGKVLRNWIHWAHRRGILQDKRIGIYYQSDSYNRDLVEQNVIGTLNALGYNPAETATTDSTLASQQDAIAVQRFQAAGVDLALLPVSSVPAASFMRNAESQAYRPQYIDTDIFDHTADATTSLFPPDQYDRTLAMTGTLTGRLGAGMGLSREGEACVRNYERYSGQPISREAPESAELYNILVGCDDASIVLRGVQGAGRVLTVASFIAAMQSLGDPIPMSGHGDVSYEPLRHHGVHEQRTIRWSRDCTCWKASGKLRPFWVD